MEISTFLKQWYAFNMRPLPWRNSKDPYVIWVSEIILQQTRIAQGTAYFKLFLETFPDISILAASRTEDVLLVWQGLGYYSRARNMHATARTIMTEHGGTFPGTYNELIQLKGIGPYTAAAISSIAFGEARAVVDGNVHRVISRIFDIAEAPGISPGRSMIHAKASLILDRRDPGTHNQALMELGAMVCTPLNPDCQICPLVQNCHASRNGKTDQLPVRKKKVRQRIRYFHYLVILNKGHTFIRQRQGSDIWEQLYEFPLIETGLPVSPERIATRREWLEIIRDRKYVLLKTSKVFRHQLTHQEIRARFYCLIPSRDPESFHPPDHLRIRQNELVRYPVPALVDRSMKELRWLEGTD